MELNHKQIQIVQRNFVLPWEVSFQRLLNLTTRQTWHFCTAVPSSFWDIMQKFVLIGLWMVKFLFVWLLRKGNSSLTSSSLQHYTSKHCDWVVNMICNGAVLHNFKFLWKRWCHPPSSRQLDTRQRNHLRPSNVLNCSPSNSVCQYQCLNSCISFQLFSNLRMYLIFNIYICICICKHYCSCGRICVSATLSSWCQRMAKWLTPPDNWSLAISSSAVGTAQTKIKPSGNCKDNTRTNNFQTFKWHPFVEL